jgi:hypothetical protein
MESHATWASDKYGMSTPSDKIKHMQLVELEERGEGRAGTLVMGDSKFSSLLILGVAPTLFYICICMADETVLI